jgi:NAD(P)-dependent dehydrogenase (short-subunit alcohol dehydrogenase family)
VLVQGDVSQEDQVVAMVGKAVSELGGLDILITNAGIQISCHGEELSSEDFDMVLAVNIRGAFLCAREAIRLPAPVPHAGARGQQDLRVRQPAASTEAPLDGVWGISRAWVEKSPNTPRRPPRQRLETTARHPL